MNVVSLVNTAEKYLGQKVTVEGILDRPRKKHSSYVFFNVAEGENLVQVVVKKDLLGNDRFKELTYGLSHKDKVSVTGVFDKRSSDRSDFADYEITAEAISKEVK